MSKMMESSLKAIKDLGLNWTPAQKEAYLSKIKVVYLPRLKDPYPENDFYVAGTPKAKEQWDDYWADKFPPTVRKPYTIRRETLDMDISRFKYIVKQDESIIVRDADTKELVFVAIRDLIPDDEVKHTMTTLCKEITRFRQNDKRNDAGQLVHFGYTCGSRDHPCVRLAAPLAAIDTMDKVKKEVDINMRTQGMAGIIWNLMKCKLPAEIIDDYNNTIKKYDYPRMDMQRKDNDFHFKVGDEVVTFETGKNGLRLPPPSGMSAINYARYTHNESNGNAWIVACTCKAPQDWTKGGNFYLASYGIMLQPRDNTATAWRPGDYHDAILYEMKQGPERRTGFERRADGAIHTGMIFEISAFFKTARRRTPWLDAWKKEKVAYETPSVEAQTPPTEAKTEDDAANNSKNKNTKKPVKRAMSSLEGQSKDSEDNEEGRGSTSINTTDDTEDPDDSYSSYDSSDSSDSEH
ncbi:uncharacterized protein F4822DRAFT_432228 [Hypoxylon trugodes]|uniref:uncharacterized protein n=1 Tax=Hypoxylon trugodes TaxID=326681 RepID=UPI002198A1C1|nr:uncharacterized protein F4822DRAFT_432228 [Hypoxylon trugodes]KAI1385378.1 hypothetical protein F4822DRAFT_432228 [Hypoxylon trugodes]